MKPLIIALCLAGLTACTPKESAPSSSMDHAEGQHMGIMISDARVRPPLPGRDIATAYFQINNHGAADRLLSVDSPISDRVEIHTHLNEDGVMKMRRLEGLDLAAGQEVVFQPGGLHIMLFNVQLQDDQDDVSLTLNFENAEPITVIAEMGMDAAVKSPEHSGH